MLAQRFVNLFKATRVLSHTRTFSLAPIRAATSLTDHVNNKQVAKKVEQHGESLLVVQWKDNSVSRFPYIYLRDLCTCSKCMNQNTLERLSDAARDFPLDIRASKVEMSNNGEKIQIKWPDDHVTEFESGWLHGKRLLEKNERDENRSSKSIAREGVKFWNRSEMQDNIPTFDFSKVMHEDVSLFEWLEKLHCSGIALLEDVPAYTDPTASEKLARRVGYIKSTHYGHIFDVHAKFDANNLAYTTGDLPLHCDIPQSVYYPGIQFLHCLQQTAMEGGANMFVDGFHISQEFKNLEPVLFDLLSAASIPYWDLGKDKFGDFHLKYSRPVFELDYSRNITRFTYNNHTRDYYLNETPERVKDIYNGYIKLGSMMRDPQNRIDHKLQVGEMVTFDNSRVLHGRTAFTPTKSGNRHLQGTYLDWDLIYARLRSLARLLDRPFVG